MIEMMWMEVVAMMMMEQWSSTCNGREESVVCLLAANEYHGPVLHLRQVEHACEEGTKV